MPSYWKIAAHSAYDMFSDNHYLHVHVIVNLVFPISGFWSGIFFLIAPFPDHCLLVLFSESNNFFVPGAFFTSCLDVNYSE